MEFFAQYDFVVLGEHPAALWAARKLLLSDARVLILPLGTHSGSNVLPRSVLADFDWQLSSWPDRDRDPIQILTPGRRFRVVSDDEERKEEFRFHFGRDPFPGARTGGDFIRGLRCLELGRDPGEVPDADPSGVDLLDRVNGTVYHDGESGWVVRKLLSRLQDWGAHVARPGQLRRIFLDRKNFVGVQLLGTSRMVAARYGILGSQVDHLRSMMSEEITLKSRPAGWTFDVRFECAPEVIPPGLGTRMLVIGSGAPVLEILREGRGQFRLRVTLPMQEAFLARDEQRRIAERMLAVCQKLIPDLEYNLRKVVPDVRDPERAETVDLPRLHPFDDLSRIPLDRLIYNESSMLPLETGVPNLFVVGEESLPAAGIHGGFEAAKKMFELLAKREQRPDLGQVISTRS
jgi:hypothetical protein